MITPRSAKARSARALYTPTGSSASLDRLAQSLQPVLQHLNVQRFLWLFTVVCALIAWNRGLALLWAMVACLVAALALSHAMSWWQTRGIQVERQLPHTAIAGEPTFVQYGLRARGTRYFLALHETLAPGERAVAFTPRLDANATVSGFLPAVGRGIHLLDAVEVRSAWPLGLVNHTRRLALPTAELVVLPALHDVPHLALLVAPQGGGQRLVSQQAGALEEFAGVRDYRRGDALKSVHWAGSARQTARGQPWLVKTYEQHDEPQVLIVINGAIPAGAAFEAMASIAASLARYGCYQGWPVILTGAGALAAPGQYLEATLVAPEYWQQYIAPNSVQLLQELRCLAAVQPRVPSRGQSLDSALSASHVLDAALHRHPRSNLLVTFGTESATPVQILAGTRQVLHFALDRSADSIQCEAVGSVRTVRGNPERYGAATLLAALRS